MNYDSWLTEPYDNYYYEAEKERRQREYHLGQIEGMDEEEIEDYLFDNEIDDPRED